MFCRVAFAISASIIAGSAFAVAPQRTFVASYGNDLWPCSLVQPCRGFQAAINAVAPTGEVVALDSAGYGTMEIHKSVSVIVPPGIHAGLSPSTGIPLPGYPGQYGVVLIDIQDADVVVLRGLNINHQGAVTGGIEWISTRGGKLQIEDVVVNGFPGEGLYMQAPAGRLSIKDSIFRNNTKGIYLFGVINGKTVADHVRIEHSANQGMLVAGHMDALLLDSVISSNDIAVDTASSPDGQTLVTLIRCVFANNNVPYRLDGNGLGGDIELAGSHFFRTGDPVKIGTQYNVYSHGNNSADRPLDITTSFPPQ